ncbi:MAG: 30S ribosomal protein S12 methylthiotransferase RimO [Phycisphaerales bacterium]
MPPKPKPKPNSRRTDADIRTVSFVSLGCPKNLVDSEKMLGMLAEDGLAIVSCGAEMMLEEPSVEAGSNQFATGEGSPGSRGRAKRTNAVHAEPTFDDERERFTSDAVVINTCGFLEASKDESLRVIKDAIRDKAAGLVKRVVVAGCLVQRHRAKMLEWAPGIDAMVGVFDRDKIIEAVRGSGEASRATRAKSAQEASDKPRYWIAANALTAAKVRGRDTVGLTVNGKDGKGVGYFEDDSARLRLTPRHYAYLRISEGCNQNCTFCTIPSIRGKMRSKPLEAIRSEARELIADGAFELILIGQDTTSYGDDIGMGLGSGSDRGAGMPGMLRAVARAFDEVGTKDGWVRLMYAYPSNFSEEMIDALAEMAGVGVPGKRVLPYIDMPLQHASNAMLKAMRRNVTREHQAELVHRLRERIPGMAIRTTFISGFPGETDDDHRQLLEFVEEMQFDAVGVFEYSREEGTPAGTMESDPRLAVPAHVKKQRREDVMALQQGIAFEQAAYLAEQFDEAAKAPADTGVQFDVVIDGAALGVGLATPGVGKGGRLYRGRTYFQAPQIDATTFVQSKAPLAPGELVRCTIVASDGYDLIARPTAELEKKVGLRVLR